MKFLAGVVVVVLISAFVYFNKNRQNIETPPINIKSDEKTLQDLTPSANNYEECIAIGNTPLPEDPDKCLTSDGYLFIRGAE